VSEFSEIKLLTTTLSLHLQNPSTYRTPPLTEPLLSTYRTPPLTEQW